jgi:hypothetical protein
VTDLEVLRQLDVDDAPSETTERGRVTHIVLEGSKLPSGDFLPTGDSVVAGFINRTPVTALCGAKLVPENDPKKYPICQACAEIAAGMGWKVPAG